MVQDTGFSYRAARFGSLHLHVGSHLPVTVAPEALMPPSSFPGLQVHRWYTYTHASIIFITVKSNKQSFKAIKNIW